MRVLYVVECDVPSPELVPEPIKAMSPPSLPYFAGKVRIVIDPEATHVLAWLDGNDPQAEHHRQWSSGEYTHEGESDDA